MHWGWGDELQDGISPLLCTTQPSHLWVWSAIWAFLPFGSDMCVTLRTVCGHQELFGHFANWFWHLSTVEDCLWALSVIWAFCQLVLMSNYHWGPFVSGKCFLGILYWSLSEMVCDTSVFFCCVNMYSICVTGIFVFCKMRNSGSIH